MPPHRAPKIPVVVHCPLGTTPSGTVESDVCQLEGEMVLKYQREDSALTIFLRFDLHGTQPCSDNVLVYRYDADKITANLESMDISLRPDQRAKLIRQNNADMKTLRMRCREPCLVLCMQSLDNVALRSCPNSDQLATLARAQTVHVVFDFNAFRSVRREGVQRLTGLMPGGAMIGVPAGSNDKKYRCVNLEHMSIGDTEHLQGPPSYEASQIHSTPSKSRAPKSGSISGTSRLIDQGPPAEGKHPPRTPVSGGSTTEKATTLRLCSPKPPLSPAVMLPELNLSGSMFVAVVKNAVDTLLPGVLQDLLATTHLEDIVKAIVEKVSNEANDTSSRFHASVVDLVQKTLPDVLRDLPSLNTALENAAVTAFQTEFDAAVGHAEGALEETSEENQDAFGFYCHNKANELERNIEERMEEAKIELREAVDLVKNSVDQELDDFQQRIDELQEGTTLRAEIKDLKEAHSKLAKTIKKMKQTRIRVNEARFNLGEERRKSEEVRVELEQERAKSEKERRKLKRAVKKWKEERKKTEAILLQQRDSPNVGFEFRQRTTTQP